jgi:hypothetical protein
VSNTMTMTEFEQKHGNCHMGGVALDDLFGIAGSDLRAKAKVKALVDEDQVTVVDELPDGNEFDGDGVILIFGDMARPTLYR